MGDFKSHSGASGREDKGRFSFVLEDLGRGALPAKGIRDLEKACPPLCPDHKKPIR